MGKGEQGVAGGGGENKGGGERRETKTKEQKERKQTQNQNTPCLYPSRMHILYVFTFFVHYIAFADRQFVQSQAAGPQAERS